MIVIRYFIVILFFSYFFGCSSSDPVIKKNKIKLGDYSYFMSDSSGLLLANGNLKVDYYKGNEISGTYTVMKDTALKFDGQETMKDGPFSGNYNDSLSLAFFNLNPKIADANIFIFATDYTDSLKGSWYYSTFRGKKSGGLFSAKRLK